VKEKKINFKRAVREFDFWCEYVMIPQKEWKKNPYKLGSRAITLKSLKIAEHQKELVSRIEEKDSQQLVVLKSRQQGCTTITALYMLWCALYKPGWKGLFVIDLAEKSREFRLLLENAYKSLPEALRLPLKFASNDRVYNEKLNSSIVMTTATMNTGRSETFTMSVVDELDYYLPNVQTAVMNGVMASSQKVIVACTPWKPSGRFHRLCQQAEAEGRIYKKDYWDIAADGFYGSQENAERWYKFLTQGKEAEDVGKEFLCQFTTLDGDRVCNVPESAKIQIRNQDIKGSIFCSIDIGFKDRTFVLFGYIRLGKIYIFDEISTRHSSLETVCEKILNKRYRLIWGAIDSQSKKVDLTSGISPYEFIQRKLRIPMLSKKPYKQVGSNTGAIIVNNAFADGKLFYDPDRVPLLEAMFRNLMYTKTGRIPHLDGHIDAYDSLVYGLYNSNQAVAAPKPRRGDWNDLRRRRRRF
jgi:hypothetical protein